jgi:hypothetical protein
MPSRFANVECTFAETPIGAVAWDPETNEPLIDGEASGARSFTAR